MNCTVRKPATTGGVQFLSATFKHTGAETSCNQCHSGERPAGPVYGSYSFDHGIAAYGGQGDCVSCHMANLGVSFSGGVFNHNPRPTACAVCHAPGRPTTLVGTPPFDHTANGQGDCISCHQATTSYTSKSSWAGGQAMPPGLIGTVTISNLPVQAPNFSGTTITSVSAGVSAPLPMQMLHSSTHIASGLMSTCTNCHAQAATGVYTGGLFHTSASTLNLAQPTACLDCHSNASPVGFVGPAGPSRSPASSEMRHEAVNWSIVNGNWAPSSTKIVSQDCAVCHSSGGVGSLWSGANFHTSLQKAGMTQPSSCLDCHANTRPNSPVGSPSFSHQNNGGMGDCVSCHSGTTAYTSMANWSGASNMPNTLIGGVTVPGVVVGTPTFSATTITTVSTATTNSLPMQMLHTSSEIPNGLMSSCTNCHINAASGVYTSGLFHSSATKLGLSQPTACLDCHSVATPTGFVGPAGPNRTPSSSEMRHEAVVWNAPSGTWAPTTMKIVTQDCAVCHSSSGVGTVWTGAKFHASLSSQPSSCLDCHANSRPTTVVGPAPGFSHQNNGGMGDCISCHSSSTTWTGGQFTHAGVTSCSSCHESQRPTSTSGWTATNWSASSTTFNLSTHATGTDCNSCHQTSLSKGVFTSMANWNGGNFTHSPKPASCVNCHAMPTSTTPSLTGSGLVYQDHSTYGGQDCLGCHTNPPNYTAISGWGGASSMPAGFVNGTGSAWNFWTLNTTSLSYTTGATLSTASTSTTTGVTLPQQMLHSSPAISSSAIQACTTCHTSGYSATSGTRYHASLSQQPTGNCASCHANAGVPVGIVGPKTGSSDPANMNHAVAYTSGSSIVSAQDCAACHTSGVGTTWSGASFHATTGGNSVNNCIACHVLSIPSTLSTSGYSYTPSGQAAIPQHFAHSSPIVKQDCNVCHTGQGPPNTWVTTNKIHNVIAAGSISACTACHSTDVSTTTKYPVPGSSADFFVHTSSMMTKDCTTCHAMTNHTQQFVMNSTGLLATAPSNTTGNTWAGGLWDHAGVSGSCSSCHSFSSSDNHGGNFGSTIDNNRHAYQPCMQCH